MARPGLDFFVNAECLTQRSSCQLRSSTLDTPAGLCTDRLGTFSLCTAAGDLEMTIDQFKGIGGVSVVDDILR